MVRPRSNTPEGRLATERWRETMRDRYGDPSEYMKAMGAKGGKAPTTKPKGFAANKDLAKSAGALGGRISRRGKKVVSN